MIRNAQKGFSLIELMVVVAIIGILATIAIPRVNKFIAKSRTTEAQVNLSSIYTFNKNFYVEFQGYTSGFQSMGYIPEGNLRYNTGFGGGPACPAPYIALGKACAGNSISVAAYCGVAGGAAGVDAPADSCAWIPGPGGGAVPAIPATAVASDTTFIAAAVAQLVANDDADTWTIDQSKNLRNNPDGTDGIAGN